MPRNSAPKPLRFGRTAYSVALHRALTKFVGNRGGRIISFEALADKSGVDRGRLKRAANDPDQGQWRPLDPEELLSIAAVLGPGFTTALIGHVGQGAFRLPDPEQTPLSDIAVDTAEASAAVSRAAAGRESPLLKRVGMQMMEQGAMLVKLQSPDGQVFYQERPH